MDLDEIACTSEIMLRQLCWVGGRCTGSRRRRVRDAVLAAASSTREEGSKGAGEIDLNLQLSFYSFQLLDLYRPDYNQILTTLSLLN
jgi:hypothetical protein